MVSLARLFLSYFRLSSTAVPHSGSRRGGSTVYFELPSCRVCFLFTLRGAHIHHPSDASLLMHYSFRILIASRGPEADCVTFKSPKAEADLVNMAVAPRLEPWKMRDLQ